MSTQTSPGESTSSARPWWRRWWWLAPLALLVAAALATGSAVRSARTDLRTAESLLRGARDAMGDGDIDAMREDLAAAATRLSSAEDTLRRPDVSMGRFVPTLGDDLRAVRIIVDSANDVVTHAISAAEEAARLTEADLNVDGLPVDTIEALGPLVRSASDAVELAFARVSSIRPDGLLTEVAEGRQEVLDLLEPIAAQLEDAAGVVEVLPEFLGADRPRRYLVGAANPAEFRGTGGYLGSYTVLTVDEGRLRFGSFAPLTGLDELEAGDIPLNTLPERYLPFGATWRWKNANMSPDMPSVGRTLTQMWARQTGQVLDGVLLVDPFAIETMLEVTGPVQAADTRVLDADGAVKYLTNEAYASFDDPDLRKEELGEAAKVVLGTFLGEGGALLDHLGDLSRLLSERQLQLYASDARIQRAFARAGLDGALPDPEGDFLAVVANSGTNAKVDYWLERTIDYDVRLLADFSAAADVTLSFRNAAPTSGQPKYVIGPNVEGLVAGDNRFHLSTYCATSCRFDGAEGGLSGNSLVSTELGHPVAGTWLQMPAGETGQVRYQWTTSGAWRWEGRELVYRLLVRTQTAVRRPTLRVVVDVPDGFRFAGGSSGLELREGDVHFEQRPRGDVALEVRLLPENDR